MATNAPTTSLGVIFSLNINTEKGIIRTGTMLMIVAAIPEEVYLTASNENDTPRKGPKNAPMVRLFIAGLFFRAGMRLYHLPSMVYIIVKPKNPVMTLIWVAAKAS